MSNLAEYEALMKDYIRLEFKIVAMEARLQEKGTTTEYHLDCVRTLEDLYQERFLLESAMNRLMQKQESPLRKLWNKIFK